MTPRRQAERAIEIHADALSAFPNVIGVGMSEVDDDDRPRSDRPLAVAVYVSEKKPASELDASELLPVFVVVDDQGSPVKVPVKVIEMGEIQPEGQDADGDAVIQSNEGDEGSTFFAE